MQSRWALRETAPFKRARSLTIRQLRTLVAIADAKTFSAAAEMVHVTHAAVSQQMQSLEADLGVTLFDRRTRTPELTPVAHQIVAKARQLIFDYDHLVPSDPAEVELRGVIRLGALPTTLTGLTPQAMAIVKSQHPGVGLHIRPGLTSDLLADIDRGELDAAIVTKPHLIPDAVLFRHLTKEPMHLIASEQETEADPLTLLKTRPFIRFNRNAVLGILINNWILSKRIRVNEAMELDSPEAIESMVHANLGVSIVPSMAVSSPDTLPIKRLSLGADAPTRAIGLVHSREQTRMQAVDVIFEALTTVIEGATARREQAQS